MKKIYYADFETCKQKVIDEFGDEQVIKTRVYLWAIVSGEFEKYGESIGSFIEFVKTLKNSIIYFHNLHYDFSYIHYYLIKNNIKCEVMEKNEAIYSVKFFNIELRDSMNFLPMTLKEMGENYCHVYKKTSIDYDVDYHHRCNSVEIRYCINDCRVVEEGLGNYLSEVKNILLEAGAFETASKLEKKLTNASISFGAFRELSIYDNVCPKTTKAEYDLLKDAYKGGYVYSRPTGLETNVQMIDCNSMYPYMYATIDMPYGIGINCLSEEELSNYKFFVICIRATYSLKKGYIAIIGGGIGKFGSTIYKSESEDEEELVLASKDFELIKKFYNIEYEFVWGIGYNTKPEFFRYYADTFIAMKNKEKGVRRNVAKFLLNTPYGKTAENGMEEIYEYSIDENTHSVVKEVVGYKIDESRYQYLPIAIAITSCARYYLLTTAESIGFDKVYYMDTDSIKFSDTPVSFKFDPNELGAWKDEGKAVLFKTIAPKKYGYYDGEKIHFKCAGFNQKTLERDLKNEQEVSYDEAVALLNKFDKGLKLKCLQSHIVEGGRALIEVEKEIK